MFRIRFHGRGGQGMKTASRILGSAFFIEGFEVQDAPRYGAERRGAPIFAFVRADTSPIFERGVIPQPDLVLVADDTLVAIPAAGVTQGLDAHAVLAINSYDSAEEWRTRLNTKATIETLPPFSADDPHERVYVSAVIAGAAAKLVGVIGRDALVQAVHDELASLPADVIATNVKKALDTYDAVTGGNVRQRPHDAPPSAPNWITLGAEGAELSAPTVHAGATSVAIKTGLWRSLRPIINYENCNKCNWVCGSFCPDGAITVTDDGWPQVDYDHCKGCMICVAQCPKHTIEAVAEVDAEKHGVPKPPTSGQGGGS